MLRFTTYRIVFSFVFIFLLFYFGNGATAFPPVRTVDITIEVLDSETQSEIIPYQLVYIKSYEDIKENITYLFEELPVTLTLPYSTDNTSIILMKEGYYSKSETIVPDRDKQVIFYLDPLPLTKVNIHVKDLENNSIENATIKAKAINSDEKFTGKTNENGLFTFETRMTNYEITVTKEGYYDHYQTFEVDHNVSEMNLIITLEEIPPVYHRGVYLTIKDPEGNPINNATVNIRSMYSDEVSFTNTTDENGLVTFVLTSDEYDIYVYTDTYGSEKFVRVISNKGSAYEDDLQMGVGEGTPIEQPEHKVEYKAFNVPPTLIIFIVIILFVILLLVFKVVKKPKEVENKYSL